MSTWLEWVEPYTSECDIPVTMRMHMADVIKYQRRYALEKHGYCYLSDEDAYLDFATIHWASVVTLPD